MGKYKKVIVPILVVLVLAAAFWYGGSSPGLQGLPTEQDKAVSPINSGNTPNDLPPIQREHPGTDSTPDEKTPSPSGTTNSTPDKTADTEQDQHLTDPIPEDKPAPAEPQDAVISDTAYTCTFSISCAAVLDRLDWLDEEKTELVPEDGWVLEPTEVTFYEGESVFNVLQRTCKQQKIHMEFSNAPLYNSAYIEGIHNLYELDCGELSGWMYSVNGWFPNYGCSRYALRDGDTVCWQYTCDLGTDIGGYNDLDG